MKVFALLVIIGAVACLAAASPWQSLVVGKQSPSERLATADLQRYLAQVSGQAPLLLSPAEWRAAPRPAVILGTPEGNELLAQNLPMTGDISEQGYWLINSHLENVEVVLAAGQSAEGATNAVYGLLRQLGFGFYFGSEAIPEKLPERLPTDSLVKEPVFRIRGVLPWYNFLNSPTTWDPLDHRAVADQLIRMGANFLGFHTYDAEPFAGYQDSGGWQWGAPLLNTSANLWGTKPTPTSEFPFGLLQLFSQPYFGAASTLASDDAGARIQLEQNLMRDALAYARQRGLKTCLGFELSGDPLNPQYREVFLKRLNRLLDQYPGLDYIWLWQSETQGAQGFASQYNLHILPTGLKSGSRLPEYGDYWRETFDRIVNRSKGVPPFYQDNEAGKRARANEGARLALFSELALSVLRQREDAPTLVISGWGGDERLLSAEYYEGLDRLLPKDIVFSSLDHIAPRDRVDRVYSELADDRERWPIPWLENDGDQWHPQPYVHIYEPMVKYAHEGGSQGLLGIHWRTRDIEENLAYLVEYAWDPSLTAESFFADYASRNYGPELGLELSRIESALDSLGYRWVGGGGQNECAPFSWGPGSPEKTTQLAALRDKTARLLPAAGRYKPRLQWLITRMDWVLAYQSAESAATEAERLLAQARAAQPDQVKLLAAEALSKLEAGNLAKAVRTYAQRVTTRGEYGVLATILTKAVPAWQTLVEQAEALSGERLDVPAWQPAAQIEVPRLLTSTSVAKPYEVEVLSLGGQQVWAHVRQLGATDWESFELEPVSGWVYSFALDRAQVTQPGFEVAFSFSPDAKAGFDWGPTAVTVMPEFRVETLPLPLKPQLTAATPALRVEEEPGGRTVLRWDAVAGAEFYRLLRDGQVLVETPALLFPDQPAPGQHTWQVLAIRDEQVLAESASASAEVSASALPEVKGLQAERLAWGVILSWDAAQPGTDYYKISRGGHPAEAQAPSPLTTVLASPDFSHHFYDEPGAGTWTYYVVPIALSGQRGSQAQVTVELEERPPSAPVLDLPLTALPAGADLHPGVTFTPEGAQFSGGWLELAHSPNYNLGKGFSLEFDFRADTTSGMPVLLSHGVWLADGWFAQILGGQLIVRAAQGDAQGPTIQPGVWYHVKFGYNGHNFTLIVNGQLYPQADGPLADVPATRPLVIGQYAAKDPQFAFYGVLRNFKLWDTYVPGG